MAFSFLLEKEAKDISSEHQQSESECETDLSENDKLNNEPLLTIVDESSDIQIVSCFENNNQISVTSLTTSSSPSMPSIMTSPKQTKESDRTVPANKPTRPTTPSTKSKPRKTSAEVNKKSVIKTSDKHNKQKTPNGQ